MSGAGWIDALIEGRKRTAWCSRSVRVRSRRLGASGGPVRNGGPPRNRLIRAIRVLSSRARTHGMRSAGLAVGRDRHRAPRRSWAPTWSACSRRTSASRGSSRSTSSRPQTAQRKTRFYEVDFTQPTAEARLSEIFAAERTDTLVHLAFLASPSHGHRGRARARERRHAARARRRAACAASARS